MSFTVYIIYSTSLDKYYVGHCEDLTNRLYRHNNSGSKYTKKANDWKPVYTEIFMTKGEALRRELEIKNKKSRSYIHRLINSIG